MHFSKLKAAVLGSAVMSGLLLAPAAFAQVDVSDSITEIGTAKTAVLAIGAAVLSVIVGIKLYKWARRAL